MPKDLLNFAKVRWIFPQIWSRCIWCSFRILAKIHKNKFGVRPIINCINTPTYKLCNFLEKILHPHVKKFESYIQDSQNLIQDCSTFSVPPDSILCSADFESLYTNIPLIEALDIICDFAKELLDFEHCNIEGFREILKLILFNNVFKFKKNYFLQILGIAMGILCGPTIANIFVYL